MSAPTTTTRSAAFATLVAAARRATGEADAQRAVLAFLDGRSAEAQRLYAAYNAATPDALTQAALREAASRPATQRPRISEDLFAGIRGEARNLMARDPALTEARAVTRVLERYPKLYEGYRDALREEAG